MAAARCDEVGCGSGGDEDDDVTFGVCLDDTCCCCWGSLNVKYLFDSWADGELSSLIGDFNGNWSDDVTPLTRFRTFASVR